MDNDEDKHVPEEDKEHILEKKSPYECCVGAKKDTEHPETAFSSQVLKLLSDITSGVEVCTLLLLFILGEGRFIQNSPEQPPLVKFDVM